MSKYAKLTLEDLDEAIMAKMTVDEIFELGMRDIEWEEA